MNPNCTIPFTLVVIKQKKKLFNSSIIYFIIKTISVTDGHWFSSWVQQYFFINQK